MSIADTDLIDLAGPGAFDCGYEYYREGRVVELEMRGECTIGIVDGTTLYRVESSPIDENVLMLLMQDAKAALGAE